MKKKGLYNEHTRHRYRYTKDVEKLYIVDVTEFEGNEILYVDSGVDDDVQTYKI